MKKIVILGGGISGLSAAYLIKEEAKRQNLDLDVKLVEKEQYVGGKVRSNPVDGYLCEWGPNGFLANKPQTLKLCEELGIIGNLMPSNDNACKRWVYSNNKLHKLPHSQKEFFTNSLLSFTGKLRIMAEIFVAKRTDTTDETLADFARRRLGTEALNKWITPMAGGIFAGDPETMSLKACFPRIYELEGEYRSLIKGMVKLAKRIKQQQSDGEVVENSGALGGKLTSFAGGLQELTDCLASKLGMETIITGKAIKSITKIEGGQYQIASDDFAIDADVIISALPAYAASKIIARMDSELSLQLKKIKYAPLIVACFGYDRSKIEADLNGFGYLLAKDEAIPILGSLWDSSIFMHRAPEGKVLFRTMLGGALRPELINLDDCEIEKIVKEGFAKTLGIKVNPEMVRIYRHDYAIPQYQVRHREIVQKIADLERQLPGIFFTGNAFDGVGINDCIAASYKICEKVIEYCK